MLDFVVDELVWATIRQRQEEARGTRPHTARKPDPERRGSPPGTNWGQWISHALKGGSPRLRSSGSG